MIDLRQLEATLDLWACMWEPEEKQAFETALVRAMIDDHPRPIRLGALAACQVIATARLAAASARVLELWAFDPGELDAVEKVSTPRRALADEAERLRGNVLGVELLLARVVSGADPAAGALLDWVDARDLVAVARTTLDARLFAEIERRLGRRGKYQRGRIARLLGFPVRPAAGDRAGHSPEIEQR